jgi:transposase-like protein
MAEISYRRRFSPVVIQHAVWLYLRFPLSYRDVEELLAERGLDLSYETVRSWGAEVWTGNRATASAPASSREQQVASGRDGRPQKPTGFCMPCGTKNNPVATRTSGQE